MTRSDDAPGGSDNAPGSGAASRRPGQPGEQSERRSGPSPLSPHPTGPHAPYAPEDGDGLAAGKHAVAGEEPVPPSRRED